MKSLIEAARSVCAFDWSDNDWDAVSSVNKLREELERLESAEISRCHRCDYECFCGNRAKNVL